MNTIKQITEENGKGIHSMFNACMHKAECCSKDDEIADLKRQLEEARWQLYSDGELLNKIESELLGVKYAGPYDAGVRAIRLQLAESQAREGRLRYYLRTIADLRNLGRITPEVVAFKALTLPQDDTALRKYRDAVIEGCIATLEQTKTKTDNHLLRPGLSAAIKEISIYEEAIHNSSKGI